MKKENEAVPILSEKEIEEIISCVTYTPTAMDERKQAEKEIPMLHALAQSLYSWNTSKHAKKVFITSSAVVTSVMPWESIMDKEIELTDSLTDYYEKQSKYFVNITNLNREYLQITYFSTFIRRYRVFRVSIIELESIVNPIISEIFIGSRYSIELLNSIHKYIKRDVSTSLSIYAQTIVDKYGFTRIESPWYIF